MGIKLINNERYKMNVCIVAYTFYEIDYRVRRYAESLVERGDRVDVISLRREDQEPKGILNGVNIYRIQKRPYNEKSLLDYVLRIMTFFAKSSIILFFSHLKCNYKLIHIHNVPDFLVFTGLIPKLLGAKIILDIHDILPEFFCHKFKRGLDTPLAKVVLSVENISVHFADHVIVANDLWREKIVARDKVQADACTTLLYYPDLEFFKNQRSEQDRPRNGQFVIIYPGTLSYHHGLDILIRALSIVKQKLPNVKLKVYVRSSNLEYFDFIRKLVSDLNLTENVEFFNPVITEKLMEIFSDADIGVVSKRGGFFAEEAFSSKIFDFMAAGVPIIASKTKIDEYYFDDSIILFFEPENHSDLARCILELHENRKKREAMVENGKQFIGKNNWGIKKLEYLDLVDRLTGFTTREK
jgi:glycosyltransferase involved in cell wall biosynthesis